MKKDKLPTEVANASSPELLVWQKTLIFIGTLLMFSLAVFIVSFLFNCRILKSFDIDSYVWGDRLITSSNIPYEYLEYRINSKYSLVVLRNYPVPQDPAQQGKADKMSGTIMEFLENSTQMFDYVEGQKNPVKLVEQGGDCQAVAIWISSYLNGAKYRNGFLPLGTHIVNWVELDGDYYRIDAFGEGLTKSSLSDVRRIKAALGIK